MRNLLLLIATAACLCISSAAFGQCTPVDHANDDLRALNAFWRTSIPICQIAPGSRNAYADRRRGVVWADQSWLDEQAYRYGTWAATGILAHEWGHMVQGDVQGTAAELQADCLAGVFMRGVGLPWQTVEQFAQANFFAGDAEWSLGGHGTGVQRVTAARRGYYGYAGQGSVALFALCPLSAF
ncbi:MAG TPA: hypothetical protein VFH27_18640 [Longimicrobiaceae bacterium]|nr:hypothetical protein [Longimicrobiaceae bacterium]